MNSNKKNDSFLKNLIKTLITGLGKIAYPDIQIIIVKSNV